MNALMHIDIDKKLVSGYQQTDQRIDIIHHDFRQADKVVLRVSWFVNFQTNEKLKNDRTKIIAFIGNEALELRVKGNVYPVFWSGESVFGVTNSKNECLGCPPRP